MTFTAAAAHAIAMTSLQAQIAELQALVAAGLGHTGPINYVHVGSVQRYSSVLGDMLDNLKGTGEYAEVL